MLTSAKQQAIIALRKARKAGVNYLPPKEREKHRRLRAMKYGTELPLRSDEAAMAKEIAKIRNRALRGKVASLVWWDIFSNRPASEATRILDAMRNEYMGEDIDPALIAAELIRLGYHEHKAWDRAVPAESTNYKRKVIK